MKTSTEDLRSYLADVRSGAQVRLYADCFKFTLVDGTEIFLTNADFDVTLDGEDYLSGGVLISGLRSSVTTGLNVDTQQVVMTATEDNLLFGQGILSMVAAGVFDGAAVSRRQALF